MQNSISPWPTRPKMAVGGAHVVTTCTSSTEPVIESSWVKNGTTIVSVGSYSPGHCEIPQGLVARAGAVVIDHAPTAIVQAGPIVHALTEGILGRDDVIGLGDVLIGRKSARTTSDQVIYYNSLGVGIQDAAATQVVLDAAIAAIAAGRGQRIRLRGW